MHVPEGAGGFAGVVKGLVGVTKMGTCPPGLRKKLYGEPGRAERVFRTAQLFERVGPRRQCTCDSAVELEAGSLCSPQPLGGLLKATSPKILGW